MSSKETVNFGGSEEMRALEYGDAGMISESSDSERMEEGVGRSEMVGVEGDRVPITVVEVEGRNERVLIRPARVKERACSAPWDHWMPMYTHYLAAGLRFPIPELLVADTEWEKRDAEVELLSSWKAKKANQNKYSLNEDEEEEVGKLVREGGKLANIMYLTSAECIKAAELYRPSALSEAEMDKFLNAAGGVAIPKKPRKKLKTSTKEARKVGSGKELVPNTLAGVEEEVGGNEVLQFVPRPLPVELNPQLRESEAEGAEVRAFGKGKGLVPPLSFQSSLFDVKNATGAKRFITQPSPKWASVKLKKRKRKISESEREVHKKEIKAMKEIVVELKKNVQLLVHNGMEEHISNFVNSSLFDNIVNLYSMPTAILAFTDCRKKVKAEYPEVDITKITFGEQEEGVEENDESMSADFCPQIKLRWDHDVERRIIFPQISTLSSWQWRKKKQR
ncbi:hypothetical protein SLEP1_g42595 [Rubroshorea leprosula]|uniref:Uncharacterized protein n=1 Tax=Rubroshorea leprosula TaxID=152421 RepID=A0AAV5LAF0_9ROSI|nr:hypothetical protein SLEP1_g42595 [Rubroshorea leprosula]